MAADRVVAFPKLYCCVSCRSIVADHNNVLRKNLAGFHGRAFLFSTAMNVSTGPPEDLRLATGVFTIADVYCSDCNEYLGYKYLHAYEEAQKHKEGYHVLEMYKITRDNCANRFDSAYCEAASPVQNTHLHILKQYMNTGHFWFGKHES